MPKCCGASCDCNIQAGAGITVTGVGSIDDPFVVAASTFAGNYDWAGADVEVHAPDTGTADPVPGSPAGYLHVVLNGEDRLIPFF